MQAHLDDIVRVVKEAEGIVSDVADALKPLDIVTPIFDAINSVMQYFT